jgi:hypothetical protein
MVEKQFDKSILCLHDDKGGEFIGIKWDAFFAQHGIWREHTVKASPQQNGVAECLNRTLEELLVAMLNRARLPARFWGEGLNYLRHVIVRSLSSSIPAGTTPYEMVHKRKPDYSPLRVFGCRTWAHIQRKEQKSLQDHAKPCIFLGCPEDFKGWKLWDPSANGGRGGIIVSRDIVWNEEVFPGLLHVAHDAIPKRFGRSAEPGDAEHSPDDKEVSDSTDSEGLAIPLPFEPAAPPSDSDSSSSSSQSSSTGSPTPSPPRTPPRTLLPREEWPALSPQAPRLPTRVAPWPQQQGTVPVVAPRTAPASRPAAQRPAPAALRPAPATPALAPNAAATGLRRSARSNAGVAPAANWFDATVQLKGKVKGVPVASYREHGTHLTARPCARTPAPLRKPSAGPSNEAPPMPDVKEEEEAAPEAPREPLDDDDDNDNDLHAQPQARLARRLALDGVAEMPADIRALLAQGLRSIYGNNDEYIELPEAMDRAFCTAVDAKAVSSDAEPKSYCEAMRRPDSELWHQAMVRKMEAHLENGTWELVKLQHRRKAIGSKWVFKVKRNPDGTVKRYKARLVTKGFGQRPGVDFDEMFAPTTKWAALRAILALAVLENLELESIDISNAYLNGELHEVDVCMQQPDGFAERNSTWVARLLKGLYSLKQGGREWFRRLEEVLVELGFARIRSDSSVFIWEKDGVKVIVPVFVDDITLASKSKEKIAKIKGLLAQRFKLRNLGPTSFLLGVQIDHECSARTLHLSQRQYTLDLLDHFGFADCSPVSTPLDPGLRLGMSQCPQTPEDDEFMRDKPYVSAVGALMYLAIAMRPDIAHAVGVLCHFMSKPGTAHWKAAKHLFCYLRGSVNYHLTYTPDLSSSQLFMTYSDADHGGNPDNGRSTSAYVVKMGTGAVSWMLRLQSIVALSTTEAEFISAVSAGQEIVWMHSFLGKLGYSFDAPLLLLVDNQSAIQVARNPEHHRRMKHLDLRFFWLRDMVNSGVIAVHYIPTADMAVDLLTKALARVKVAAALPQLGLTAP